MQNTVSSASDRILSFLPPSVADYLIGWFAFAWPYLAAFAFVLTMPLLLALLEKKIDRERRIEKDADRYYEEFVGSTDETLESYRREMAGLNEELTRFPEKIEKLFKEPSAKDRVAKIRLSAAEMLVFIETYPGHIHKTKNGTYYVVGAKEMRRYVDSIRQGSKKFSLQNISRILRKHGVELERLDKVVLDARKVMSMIRSGELSKVKDKSLIEVSFDTLKQDTVLGIVDQDVMQKIMWLYVLLQNYFLKLLHGLRQFNSTSAIKPALHPTL